MVEQQADGWIKVPGSREAYQWDFGDFAYNARINVWIEHVSDSYIEWTWSVDFGSYEVRAAIRSDVYPGYKSAKEAKDAALSEYLDMERKRYKDLNRKLKRIKRGGLDV